MEEDMNALIPNEIGIWIECCIPTCKKWRYVIDIDDPLMVPEKWYCHMNSDQSANTCLAPERLELPENEVFVESKFKAGSIVWAKVIGYPWWPAIVDFCPDFECYYWFDNPDSNIPTQYHVKFIGQKRQSQCWIKSDFVKPLVGNDEAFALQAKIRGKKLTPVQRETIINNYKIAKAALPLPILQRLKKFSYNSWKISSRLRNQSTNTKLQAPIVPIPSDNGNSINEADRRSDSERKNVTSNENKTQKLGTKLHAQLKNFSKDGEKCSKDKSLTRKSGENQSHKNINEGRIKPTTTCLTIPVKLYQSDSTMTYSSTDTWTSSTAITSRESEEFDDMESNNSISIPAKNYGEEYLRNRILNPIKRHAVNLEGKQGIKNKEEPKIIKRMKNEKGKIDALDKKFLSDNNDKENERIAIEEELEIIADSPQPGPSKLSLELDLLNEKRKKNFQSKNERKSMSVRLFTNDNNKTNGVTEESRYLKALACFSAMKKSSIVEKPKPIKPKTKVPPVIHTLPEWFYNADLRREEEAQSFSKLFTELSEVVESRIKREMRESVLSEISASSRINSLEGNPTAKSYLNQENVPRNILTSDDESFS